MKRRTVLQAMVAAPVAAVVPALPKLPYTTPTLNTLLTPATVANEALVHLKKHLVFNTIELTSCNNPMLSIDEYQRRYIQPAIEHLAKIRHEEEMRALLGDDQWPPAELEKMQA